MKPHNSPSYQSPALTETLLIADQSDITRYTLRESLQPYFKVLMAKSGTQALVLAIKYKPALVITNLRIDGLDGLELCEKLKNNFETTHIPVIVITSEYNVDTWISGFNLGVDDIIQIPFDTHELKARISNRIAIRKSLSLRHDRVPQFNTEIVYQSVDEKFMNTVNTVVYKFINDSKFNVNQFAREVGVSNAQLYRKLHAITGLAPNDFIRNVRLEYSMKLIQNQTGNISEIAYQVGFSNLSYFSKCFRHKFGIAPSGLAKSGEFKTHQSNIELMSKYLNPMRSQMNSC